MSDTEQPDKLDFERTMSELDETVRRLEAGDLPLEESLAAFERGIALVRALHTRLDAVQMRIDELTQSSGGGVEAVPLAAAGTRAGKSANSRSDDSEESFLDDSSDEDEDE